MMSKGRKKSAAVYLAAAILLMCCLVQTIDCYRLKKTGRREGRKEADSSKTIGVQEGKVVFGRVFKKGSGLESQVIDGTKKPSSNSSTEDAAAYQADFTGWSEGQVQDASSREAAWRLMSPSLQCGGDKMKFSAVGPGVSQFTVEQENTSPMPLSQVPYSCGYSMLRNSLVLVMLVPYDGCNMVQEGGSYVLPMHWQGIPVSLWCRAPATAAPQPQHPWYPPSYPVAPPQVVPQLPPQQMQALPQKVPLVLQSPPRHVPHVPLVLQSPPRHVPLVPQLPNNQHYSLPVIPESYYFPPYAHYPLVPEAAAKKPQMPKLPLYPPFFHPYYYFPHPVPAAPTATAKPAATAPPSMLPYPFYHSFPWHGSWPLQATAKPATTTAKPQPQHIPYMSFPPQYPFLPPYFQYPSQK
ncbi:titin-like [Anarrhichthys ocellatus]|uniref:titin-like n=1 Tax=Anarrhichthys ocellatus TaxID=433405 RepID=UPI0012EEC7FB|nr:titin-like [Anarrhichthys ocellatus]